ncbi:unnamed protein product, partial [Laminaria digitata]
MKHANCNVDGVKTSVYCHQHSEEGMVDVRNKVCLYNLCTRRPTFGIGGTKTPVYCKQHAVDGIMVNVRHKLCSHDPCMKYANFNVEDIKTPMYCKQHAQQGMVNVRTRCSPRDCPTTKPTNVATMASTGH